MSLTIKDVAKEAGVSFATASRVLGNYGYVSQDKYQRVMEAAEKLGYRTHSLAKSMVTGTTKTIGLVVGDIENPFFAGLASWINSTMSLEGYTMMVYTTDENSDEEARGVYTMIEKRVDGIIIAPASTRTYNHIQAAKNAGIGVVTIDRQIPELELDAVVVNNSDGAFEAVNSLIQLGHQRIGFISDSLDISSNLERLDGYKRALETAGIPILDSLIETTGFTILDGYRKAVASLRNKNHPTAIFAANNFIMTGLLLSARDMGIQIPSQISVIGFDDMEWYKLSTPTISVVAQPLKQIGQTAARLLLKRMLNKDRIQRPEVVSCSTQLILRESTAPPGKQ
jgi:LacI family transcriptional regulator